MCIQTLPLWHPEALTDEGGGARAEAGEGQQAMPGLLHTHYHVVLRVQERRNQLQTVALQHLNVERHTLCVALHCPHLQQRIPNDNDCLHVHLAPQNQCSSIQVESCKEDSDLQCKGCSQHSVILIFELMTVTRPS